MTKSIGWRGRLAIAGPAALVAVVVTACGSSGGSTPTASSATPSVSASAQLSQLAACIGQHGVTVTAPDSAVNVRAALKNVSQSDRRAALAACREYLGGGVLSTASP